MQEHTNDFIELQTLRQVFLQLLAFFNLYLFFFGFDLFSEFRSIFSGFNLGMFY